MNIDRTTKILLALIATALWANVLVPLVRPKAVEAQNRLKHWQIVEASYNQWAGLAAAGGQPFAATETTTNDPQVWFKVEE